MIRPLRSLFVFSLVIAAMIVSIIVLACGGSSGSSEAPFGFEDSKGRRCSHEHYKSLATCPDAEAHPTPACTTGSHACFIVYVGQTERGDAGALARSMMWNCEACCQEGSSAWTGLSTSCASIVCTNDDPCRGQDGLCDNGKCRVRLPTDPKP